MRQATIHEFFARLLCVYVNENAVGGLSLAAVARHCIAVATCSSTARGDTSLRSAAPVMRFDALLPRRIRRIPVPVIRGGPREGREDTPQGQPMEVCLLQVERASWPGGPGESPMGPVHPVVSFLAVRDQAASQNPSPRSYRGNAETGQVVVFPQGPG